MPPPNANGNLHMGHAMFRHRGSDDPLPPRKVTPPLAPGADRTGIETQVVYERLLEKQSRKSLRSRPR
ncbi:hypothetical protein IPG36_02100 [bacterium]|nr:MAG: hypothetical protein IPG36_02100 [bacterium]